MATFASTGELGDYLGEILVDARLAKAALVLEIATAQIKGWCRQRLELVAGDTITLRGTGDRDLVLPERPIVEVSNITIDAVTAAPSSYYLAGDTLVRFQGWCSPASIVTVVYTHGFDPLPDDIRGVCLDLAAHRMAAPAGVRQEAIGTYSVTYGEAGKDDDPFRVLSRYRRRTGSPRLDVERPDWPYPVANAT